jgi:plastocyanin
MLTRLMFAAAALVSACGETAATTPAATGQPPPAGSQGSGPVPPGGRAPGGAMAIDASCIPSGTSLQLSAGNLAFDTACLAAPAERALTIHFDNRVPVAHNVSIFTADPMQDRSAKVLFRGETIVGPRSVDYAVGALPPGVYHFHCDVHPTQMFGAFVVK